MSRDTDQPAARESCLVQCRAFIAGVALASHIKSGRAERVVPRPLVWTMAIQAVALGIIGFVPASVPHSYVTVPISFLAAMQIGLFRNVGELVYLPVATTGNLKSLATQRPGTQVMRGIYGTVGMVLNFGAVILLPLAEATTINFTVPIWAVLLSILLLKEKVGVWRWSAVLLGFVGILVIAQPGGGHFPLYGALVALGGAFMIALISIQVADLNRTDKPLTIVFYFACVTTPITALALPFVMTAHDSTGWWLLLGIGLFLPVLLEFLRTGLVPRLPTAVLSTGLVLLSFLSFACGLILDTVTRGRMETKRIAYLSIPGPDFDPRLVEGESQA